MSPRQGSWPDRIERYEVHGVAGVGGMGTVLRATDTVLQREVALKVIGESLEPSDRRRLFSEAKHLAALQHPHVVQVYDAGEADGLSYVAMQWVDGPDLADVVQAEGPLAMGRAAQLVAEVASALDAAHARGLIHRDVKPSNVLLCQEDERALLADFGTTVHQKAAGSRTATGEIVATADFAAPEQIEGRPVDGRADVYALGCVAYWLLTGAVPYPRESAVAAMWAHVNEPPPSVRDLRPEVPEQLDAAIRRAMAKDPADRFASAGALAAAMVAATPAAAVEPPTAQLEAPPEPSHTRRRRSFALAGVAALVIVALGLAALTLRPDDAAAPVGAAESEAQSDRPKERKRAKRRPKRQAAAAAAVSATPTPAASPPPVPQQPSDEREADRDDRDAAPKPPREDEDEWDEPEWEPEAEEPEPVEPEPTPETSQPPPEEAEPPPGEGEPPPQ